jgi:hypothetical protein
MKRHSLTVLFWLEGPAKMSCWFMLAQSYMNSLIMIHEFNYKFYMNSSINSLTAIRFQREQKTPFP